MALIKSRHDLTVAIGDLRERIVLQDLDQRADTWVGLIETRTDLATRWAAIVPYLPKQYINGMQVGDEPKPGVTVYLRASRDLDDLNTDAVQRLDRMLFWPRKRTLYRVRGAREIHERRRFLELSCEELRRLPDPKRMGDFSASSEIDHSRTEPPDYSAWGPR
ncbi:head-tail adaptor protein [Elstera cyanobacteriorum]|uniref:head-tail adaptor protein n=1 Tax=Elstera cyanobacteriorum TaxID=2022747 RepID=UPI002356579F|nr:head-tail adaptor protein [Elstera cyanobacteriorum]MCK6442280.1 head-tail adaptor protein [Elstera cyanobacteriorum]